MPRLITTLLFASLITALFTFGLLEWIGGYSYSAGLVQNATLRSYIGSIGANASNNNLFGIHTNLTNVSNSSVHNLNNPTNIFSQITGGIGAAASFIGAVGSITNAIVTFAALPLTGIGIQIGYARAIIALIIIVSVVLTIISAILIFPL